MLVLEKLEMARQIVESIEHSREELTDDEIKQFDKLLVLIHRVCHAVMNNAKLSESRLPWTNVPIWKDVR